jgi:hypothetical protein
MRMAVLVVEIMKTVQYQTLNVMSVEEPERSPPMDKVSEVDKTLRQIPIDANDSSVGLHLGIKTAKHSLLALLIERLEKEQKTIRPHHHCGAFGTCGDEFNEAVQSCINAVKEMFGEGV